MAYDKEAQARRFAESAAKLKAGWAKRNAVAQSAAEARRIVEERGGFAAVETGTDYERFVDGLITAAGFKVRRVGGSGDMGADLLVETGGGRIVVQCKFYSSPVGYAAVQEAYTAKALYGATAAVVCSNARFTRQARRTASKLGVTLCGHGEIVARLSNASGGSTTARQTAPAAASGAG